MVWWNKRLVKVLTPLASRGVAAAAAFTTALETVAAFATARETTTEASCDTPNDREDDKTTYDDNCDHWPLANAGLHAIIPTRVGSCGVFDVAFN